MNPPTPNENTAFWRPDWGLERLGVRMHLSFRSGGVSKAPYDSMNLGLHVGDDPHLVQVNRDIFQEHLGVPAVFMDQKHGIDILEIGPSSPRGLCADAAFTTQAGVACTMMVADCMPLLLADERGRMVGAVHVGWRGLVGLGEKSTLLSQSVVENAHRVISSSLAQTFDQPTSRLYAWLGPCIGPTTFEVSEEVVAAFTQKDPLYLQAFQPHRLHKNKWLADLPHLVRLQLKGLGVCDIWGNDGSSQWCTVSRPDLYFSHRRDRVSGRFAASIWLEPRLTLELKL